MWSLKTFIEAVAQHRVVHLCIAFGLVLFAPGLVSAQDSDGSLLIEVKSAETSRPIAGVEISVTGRDGNAIEGRTDAQGAISFDQLPEGLYAITAAADGRVSAEEPSVRVTRRKTTPLVIEMIVLDESIDEIVVVARGRVADQFGACQ